MIVIKGQRLPRNTYRLLGTTFIGGAVVIEFKMDSTVLWHKQVSHMDERKMMETHKKNILKGVKICKLNFCMY